MKAIAQVAFFVQSKRCKIYAKLIIKTPERRQ